MNATTPEHATTDVLEYTDSGLYEYVLAIAVSPGIQTDKHDRLPVGLIGAHPQDLPPRIL
jgi:predicted metal-dependent enzyme (double-stranded beta helix superfamily)